MQFMGKTPHGRGEQDCSRGSRTAANGCFLNFRPPVTLIFPIISVSADSYKYF